MKDVGQVFISAIAVVAFLTVIVVPLIGMTMPTTIVYYESSPVMTATQTVKVVEHSQAYFITPEQKERLDFIRGYAFPIWIAGLLVLLGCLAIYAWS